LFLRFKIDVIKIREREERTDLQNDASKNKLTKSKSNKRFTQVQSNLTSIRLLKNIFFLFLFRARDPKSNIYCKRSFWSLIVRINSITIILQILNYKDLNVKKPFQVLRFPFSFFPFSKFYIIFR